MTLLEATIGTPWELDTKDSILVLEDRGMKPYQVDRVLMHLKQAGKFEGVRGIVLGDFPESEPSVAGVQPYAKSAGESCGRLVFRSSSALRLGIRCGPCLRYHWAYRHAWMPMGRHARILGIGGGGVTETRHVHVIGIGGSAMAPWPGCCATTVFA